MSWLTIIWSMVAAACLTLGAIHFLVWCQRPKVWDDLLFSLTSSAIAVWAIGELWLMRAETPVQFAMVLRWLHIPVWVITTSLIGFVRIHMRAGRPWIGWASCTLRTLALLLNFLVGQNLNYLEVTALRHVPFLGESVSIGVGVPNPCMLAGQLSLVLLLIFVADATITVWRRGDKRQALVIGGSIGLFALSSVTQAVLVLWQFVPWPLTDSLYFLGIVVAIAYELTRDVLRAAQLSDDLHKKNQWLDLAADSAGVGLWLWDFKTDVIWATETGRMLYGFSSNELITFDKLISMIHPDDQDWIVQASRKCIHEGSGFNYDYRLVLPDGSIRWFRVLAKALLRPTGEPEGMTGVSIDITERKQMAQELLQKRTELSNLLRVSTLSTLSVSLAHELKRPLGNILRNAEAAELFLQTQSPDIEEVLTILEDIRKDDQRAGELIDRMRSQLMRQEGGQSLLDLNLLVGEVITLVRHEAVSRKIQLEFKPVSLPFYVHGDRIQLQQVILNLLLNSMDAMINSTLEDRRVVLHIKVEGAQVEIVVYDTGHGIPADKLDCVFDLFFTTKPDGLGMGLAISRDIIEAHGGRLYAKNNETGGAMFIITLPSAGEDSI